MNMVLVSTDLKKRNLVAQGNLKADLLKHLVNIGVEDRPPIFGAANNMVQKNRNIVALANECTHALQ
jgi:hypothetical protein